MSFDRHPIQPRCRDLRARAIRLLAVGVLGSGAMVAGGACSPRAPAEPCTADAECGDGSVCLDGTCTAPATGTDGSTGPVADTSGGTTPVDSTTSSGDGTTTTEETTSGGSSSSESGTSGCAGHTECVARHDESWVCGPEGECISAVSSECPMLVWPNDVPQDEVVFVGSILPLTQPPYGPSGQALQNAMQLALEDFNDRVVLDGGGRLAWIACDSQEDPAVASTAAAHLVQMGVPAIVGPARNEVVFQVAENVTVPAGVMLISPAATSHLLTTLADDGLVWRTIGSDAMQANAMADRLATVASTNATAILYRDDAYGMDLLTNTYSALPGPVQAATTTFDYTAHPDMMDLINEIGALLGPVAAIDQPETIVILGTREAEHIILTYLDIQSQINPPPPLPEFIVSHAALPALTDAIVNAPDDATRTVLYAMTEGISPIVDDEPGFDGFTASYEIRFGAPPPPEATPSYDATIVVALAIAAHSAGDPIDGSSIASAVALLTDLGAPEINLGGLAAIGMAASQVAAGNGVNLRGYSGDLDFDLATGDIRSDLLGWEPVAVGGELAVPELVMLRRYTLAPMADDGVWMDLP